MDNKDCLILNLKIIINVMQRHPPQKRIMNCTKFKCNQSFYSDYNTFLIQTILLLYLKKKCFSNLSASDDASKKI